MSNSRAKKSIYNIVTSLVIYTLNVLITFFSRGEFLDALGPEVLGLRYTIGNFFSLTALAELGLGTVVGFSLYKPLVDNNREEICDIISLQGWVYRKLAMFVLIAALLFCAASPFMFRDFQSPTWYIYASTFVLALGSMSSYLIGFHSVILYADQKGYKLSLRTSWVGYAKNILQLLVLLYVPNPYPYYLAVELLMTLLVVYIIEYVVRREYPWLKIEPSRGRTLYPKYERIVTKVKQIVAHKVAGVVLINLSPLLMTAFSSLVMIGLYDNYMNLARNLSAIMLAVFGSLGAGIGTLVAEQDFDRIIRFFDEYRAVVYFCSVLICFALYNLSHAFISLWIGDQYLISDGLLALITLYTYISVSRTSRDSFILAYGLVSDTWAAILEAALNVGLGLLLGYFWGMIGVLIGVLISLVIVPVIWRSIYLYRQAFGLSPWLYWRNEFKYWLLSFVFIVGGRQVIEAWNGDFSTYTLLILNGGGIMIFVALALLAVFYLISSGMRAFVGRVFRIARHRLA